MTTCQSVDPKKIMTELAKLVMLLLKPLQGKLLVSFHKTVSLDIYGKLTALFFMNFKVYTYCLLHENDLLILFLKLEFYS